MGEWFVSIGAFEVMAVGVAFFAVLYLSTGALAWWLGHGLLPALGIGRRLDTRPLPRGQLRRELVASASSILIFGCGLVVPWGLLRAGWAQLAVDPPAWRVLVEIVVLFFWNDVHFWVNHRLLHTRWLRRFHGPHHRSIVTTPFSTYGFHPVEALMLGNVTSDPDAGARFQLLVAARCRSSACSSTTSATATTTSVPTRVVRPLVRGEPAAPPAPRLLRGQLRHSCWRSSDRWAGTMLPLDAAAARLTRKDAS